LLGHGLVDELHVWIVPVTAEPGQRLFDQIAGTKLELTGTRTLSTGVVILTYAPSRAA
jgi:dihydrofolate reductase